ncbi:MAG TPA: VWA domain-containing protein [Acidimicrobiales bacterium]|nr:VWA domain-containing protein [Acidimicrobiales bacterium]
MLDLLSGFVTELRHSGLPVSLTEHLDAAEAVQHIPLEDRDGLKYALAATLVKSSSHWRAFETAFEVFFAVRPAGTGAGDESEGELGEDGEDGTGENAGQAGPRGQGRAWKGGGAGEGMTPEELAELLFKSLISADTAMMNVVARNAVDRYAGMEPGRPVGGTYYLYRTLRNLDLDGVLERLMEQAQAGAAGGSLTDLEERLAADEFKARIEKFRRAVETEIRQRLVEDRGAEALARSVRKPLPEDIDVMHATREELAVLHRVLQPLSRKLAVRLARKRRHGRKGPLDFRATMRRSLSTGGVPIEPRFRHPRPAKPEIFVIADISGSVASFARFTLHLVYAISSQFSKVRSFVFVDGIDEVTRFFEGVVDPAEAVARINTEADVIWVDGHSDYGHALTEFHKRWGDQVTSRSSVMILGDARNNYHASQSWVVEDLQARARHVFWLNPEPRDYWGSGDSIVGEYGIHCDDVVECRTLRQLERFVGNLA